MPADFAPNLGELAADYRILAELRRAPRSRTFLGRHIRLNRDVIVTVTGAPRGAASTSLMHYAADARTLSAVRHPNVVPVVDARWLSDGSLAVVRARVRGPTLDAAVRSNSFSLQRIASVLAQAEAAVRWARENGIVNRYIAGDGVVLQQGSGRVLIELEAAPGVAFAFAIFDRPYADEYNDARTIEQLAYAMLTGQQVGDAASAPLAELRPELPEPVLRELSLLAEPDRSAPAPDARILIEMLGVLNIPRPAPAMSEAAVPAPIEPPADAAFVMPQIEARRSYGFLGRLAILALGSTMIGAVGTLLYRRGSDVDAGRGKWEAGSGGNGANRGNSGNSGETVNPPPAVKVAPSALGPMTSSPSSPASAPTSTQTTPSPPVPTRTVPSRREQLKPMDQKPDGGPSQAGGLILAACDSPDAGDQHTCLTSIVEQNDRVMNGVYRRLVAALRRSANAQPGEPDPAPVDALRQMQRDWLSARDVACRYVGDGARYAESRAQCFTNQSAKRTRELRQALGLLGEF